MKEYKHNCAYCETDFVTKNIRYGRNKYCSNQCLIKHRKEHLDGHTGSFKESINKTNLCWEWIGKINSNGYGYYRVIGTETLAHRISFELHHKRKISKGLYICHRCDNTTCVNPLHLFEGTHQDNMKDAIVKGKIKGWIFYKGQYIKLSRSKKLTKI